MFRSNLACRVLGACLLVLLACGCEEVPQIEMVHAPKPPKVEADRMLAAIVPAQGKGWFFKLQGSSAAVTDELPKFQELLASVQVKGDKVTWSNPEGWDETTGSGMRAATIKVGKKRPQLECSVIALPAEDPTTDDYLLANINRWRGQMSLGNISKADIEKAGVSEGDIRKLSSKDGTLVTWVNFEGTATSGGSAPFMNMMDSMGALDRAPGQSPKPKSQGPQMPDSSGSSEKTPKQPPATSSSDELSYDVPSSWKRGPVGQFRKASFLAQDGDETAEITVSTLSADGSAVLPNVNRWCQQVELKPVDEAGLNKVVTPFEVSGNKGYIVELVGKKKTIHAVSVVVGELGWFFKLTGPNAVAAKEKENFASFVKSVKFK